MTPAAPSRGLGVGGGVLRREALEFLGHGIDGGFYYIDMGGIKLATPEHMAVITVLPDQELAPSVVISAETIRMELTSLDRGFTWVVRELSATEFAVAFPSLELLRCISWGAMTTLPVHNIKVSIKPSSIDPDAPPPLATVWIRIHGIPSEARAEPFLELISEAVGKLMEIDAGSLPGDGPVRLRVRALDPSKLNVTLPPFYFDGVGRTLVVELEPEGDQPRSSSPQPRRSLSPHHSPSEGDDSSGDDPSDDDDLRGEHTLPCPEVSAPAPQPPAHGGAPSLT